MARTETVEFTNMCMICDGSRVVVIDRKKRDWPGITFPGGHIEPGESFFDGKLHSSSEGRVWWEDIANLPNLKLSLDMRDMLRVFKEENLSEFFYYQESSAWKYVLK